MQFILNDKEDLSHSQSIFIREVVPMEWEINKDRHENMFLSFDQILQADPQLTDKENGKKTTDCEDEPNNYFGDYDESLSQNNFDMMEESNFDSSNVVEEYIFEKQNQDKSIDVLQFVNSNNAVQVCDEGNQKISHKFRKQKKQPIKKSKKRKFVLTTCKSKGDLSSETKNIPKNYGKQVIKFIKKEKKLTSRMLKSLNSQITIQQLNLELKNKKKTLNRIEDLRQLWLDNNYSKEVRIMTQIFLRKHCLPWIFNSRIQNLKYPIKYRYRIIEGVRKPEQFFYLKDF